VNNYDVDAITFFTKARSAHEGHESLLYKIMFVIFVALRAFAISPQSMPRILGHFYSAASAASALNVICSQS
jgi:hypothetical protein